MKILLLNIGLYMGGAERQICDLADRFVDMGHEVKIVALLDNNPTVRPKSKQVEVQMLGYKRNKYQTIYILVSAFFKLKKIIRQYRPDVVHSHMYHCNILSRLLNLFIKIPCLVNTAHSRNEGGRFRMFLYRITDSFASITTNVSEEATQAFYYLKAASIGRIVTVHNGIDTDKFRSIGQCEQNQIRKELLLSDADIMFLAVGRLTEAKDYDNMLSAFCLLRKKLINQSFHLFIVGNGELEDKVRKQIINLNLQSYVHLLGLRTDVNKLIAASDIYVMSSVWEGLPLVIGEAMSCEKLIVSTDAGGIKEWLGCNGIVVPTSNAELLAKGLEKAVHMSEETKIAIGKQARQRVEQNYSLNKIAKVWEQLYKKYMRS